MTIITYHFAEIYIYIQVKGISISKEYLKYINIYHNCKSHYAINFVMYSKILTENKCPTTFGLSYKKYYWLPVELLDAQTINKENISRGKLTAVET